MNETDYAKESDQRIDEVADKIAGRNWADEVHAFAMEDEADWTPAYSRGFWQESRKLCDVACPTQPLPTRPVMSEAEAKHFEHQHIKFGIHEGKTFDDVPTSYLQWLHESGERLASYLRSERGQRRQR